MAFSIGRGTLLGTGYISVTADTGAAEEKLGLLGKGLGLAAVGFTAVAAAVAGTVAMTSKFNSEMLKVQTQAGASASDVKVLSSQILNLKDVQQGPDQLAESMYHLKSIGLDNVSAMKDLKVASDLASVGGSNLEDTTNALGGAWRSGIKGAESFATAAGTVNAIIGAGNMRMSDFVSAIGTGILPAAKTFGVSLNQVGAGLALMTDEGVPAVDAATRLKMSFSLLAAPSGAAAKQLAKIGLTGLEMANTMRGPTGLVGTIQLLKDHLDASGMSLSEQAILLSHAFGGGRSSSAILTMVNNVGVLHSKLDQINSSAANLPAAIAAQQATLSAQFKMFQVQMEDTGIKIGEHLIGPVVQFMTFVNSTLIPGIGKVTGALAGMVPVDKIRADLAGLTGGVSDFFHALNPSSPKVNVPSGTPARVSAAYASQVPQFTTGSVRAGSIHAGSAYSSQVPFHVGSSFGSASSLPSGTGLSNAQRLQVPMGASSASAGTWVTPPPNVSGWAKVGTVVKGVADNLMKFAGQVGTALGHLAVAVGPTVKFLGTALGVTLLGALVLVSHILSSVVGPAFVSFTGFLAKHQGTVKFFAEVVLGALLIKMTAIGALRVATGITNLATSVLQFPVKSVSGIGKAFDGLKKAGTDFGTAASGAWGGIKKFGSAIADVGRSVGNLSSKAWDSAAQGAKNFGTLAKNAAQDTAQLAVNAGKALSSMAKSAWEGAVSGAQAVGGALKTASISAWGWVTASAASAASAAKQAAIWVAQKAAALAQAAATGIATAAQWLWNLAMDANPIALVVIAIAALVAGIIWVATKTTWFETAWKYTWGAIKDAAKATWDFLDKWVIQPIATAFSWLWTHAIEPALRFIVVGFLDMAGSVLKGAAYMLGWIPGLGGNLKSAVKAFDVFRDGVNAALGGINPKTVPVTVSFNGVPQGQITGHSYTSTTGFSYADGGQIPSWAGSAGRDSVPIMAMPEEFIVNTKSTRKHLKLLQAINSGNVKAYAQGGMVGFSHAASSDMAMANRMDIAAEVKQIASSYAHAYNTSQGPRGLAWARTQIGMPYQWGGDGNPSWDCSGFMSAIESVMRGEAPHRRWATGAFSGSSAPPGWVQNANAPFMIGITNAGVGHTAGTLMGVNVEMSTVGGRVGGNARGANDPMFPSHYGLATFDHGGWLMPGKTLASNNTGRPERVVGPHESHGNTFIFNFTGPVGSQAELENWTVKTLTSLKQRGRLRGLVGS